MLKDEVPAEQDIRGGRSTKKKENKTAKPARINPRKQSRRFGVHREASYLDFSYRSMKKTLFAINRNGHRELSKVQREPFAFAL